MTLQEIIEFHDAQHRDLNRQIFAMEMGHDRLMTSSAKTHYESLRHQRNFHRDAAAFLQTTKGTQQ